MTRLEIYNEYLGGFSSEGFDRTYEHVDTFYEGGVRFNTYRRSEKEFITAYICIGLGVDDKILEVDGCDYHVIKIDSIRNEFGGIPCIVFTMVIKEYYKFIVDFSGCDMSNILDIRFKMPENNYDKIRLHKIIYPTDRRMIRPVRAQGIVNCNMYQEAIKSVDFSDLHYADNFLNESNIEYFNFNDMDTRNLCSIKGFFKDCSKLKKVEGRIESEHSLSIDSMFKGCISLIDIDNDMFSRCNIISVNELFSCCRSLKNKPLYWENVKNLRDMAYWVYNECNTSDSENMFMLLSALGCERYGLPLRGMHGVFKAGKAKMHMKDIVDIFDDSEFSIIDLSQVEFIDCDIPVISMFAWFWYRSDWLDSYLNCDDSLHKISGLPDILINDSAKIMRIDLEVFDVFTLKGITIDEVITKVNLATALGCNKHALVIV